MSASSREAALWLALMLPLTPIQMRLDLCLNRIRKRRCLPQALNSHLSRAIYCYYPAVVLVEVGNLVAVDYGVPWACADTALGVAVELAKAIAD